jgi:phosphatidylglycerol lysyltransferase
MEKDIKIVQISSRFLSRGKRAKLFGLLVALQGILNISSAMLSYTPERLAWLQKTLPAEIIYSSRSMVLLSGFFLLSVAWNLGRRKKTAWLITIWMLILSIISYIFKNLDIEEITITLSLLGLLWLFRRDFTVKSDPTAFERLLTSLPSILTFFCLYAIIGFYILKSEFTPSFEVTRVIEETLSLVTFQGSKFYNPVTFRASFFQDSVIFVAGAVVMNAGFNIMRPIIIQEPSMGDKDLARKILHEYGVTSNSYFTMGDDKSYMFNQKGTGYIAYVVKHGVAVTAGDPVCSDADVVELVSDFLELCDENGWTPVFNLVEERYLDEYLKHGLKKIKSGEEGIIDLQNWSISGKAKEDIRGSYNKGKRNNWIYEIHREEITDVDTVDQIRKISDQWLSGKFGGEMSFMMSITPMYGSSETLVTMVKDAQGKIMAFMTWAPIYGQNGWTGDYIRRIKDSPNGVMDFLLVSTILELKESGYSVLGMGAAPFYGVGEDEKQDINFIEKGMKYIYENVNDVYHYKQLFEFKDKFGPRWENRYIVIPSSRDLPKIIIALVNAHMPNLKIKDIIKLLS